MTIATWITIILTALTAVGALLAGQHQLIQRLIVAKYETDRKDMKEALEDLKSQIGQLLKSFQSQGARIGAQERRHSRLVGFLEGKGILAGMSGLNEEDETP